MCPKMCPNTKPSRRERACKSLIYKDGGPGIRTPKRSRAAVFKTAALPARSSPPEDQNLMSPGCLPKILSVLSTGEELFKGVGDRAVGVSGKRRRNPEFGAGHRGSGLARPSRICGGRYRPRSVGMDQSRQTNTETGLIKDTPGECLGVARAPPGSPHHRCGSPLARANLPNHLCGVLYRSAGYFDAPSTET